MAVTCTLDFQLNIGKYLASGTTTGTGWGYGGWGIGPWGGSGSVIDDPSLNFRLWSFHNRGEDLIASPSAGEIYIFSIADNIDAFGTGSPYLDSTRRLVTLKDYAAAHGTTSVSIPNNNLYTFTSIPDGRIISLGCNQFTPDTTAGVKGDFTPNLVRWSDNDLNDKDIFDWGPRSTNTSGGNVLEKGTIIKGYIQTTREKLCFCCIT